jgi:hypothetical protein
MTAIEVDFDVYKELTIRRQSESDTYNDVLRRLLKLGKAPAPKLDALAKGANFKGVLFPDGSLFRATYKGRTYTAEIKDGVWLGADGERRASPSEAAVRITGNNVNGWRFWQCKRPGDPGWHVMDRLRPEPANVSVAYAHLEKIRQAARDANTKK